MASANVVELTGSNWTQEVVNSDKPVLVDFWASWCAPCRALSPLIDRLAEQYAGKVKVGKLNTDDENASDIAARYGINTIPQVLLFKGGSDQPVDKIVGALPEANFVKMINRALEA
jgi:thioredoxin 1